jgi:hypothetical protein
MHIFYIILRVYRVSICVRPDIKRSSGPFTDPVPHVGHFVLIAQMQVEIKTLHSFVKFWIQNCSTEVEMGSLMTARN